MHVLGDEGVVDDLDPFEHVRALRDDLAPMDPLGVPGIDRHDALAGSVEVGEEVEHGPVVPHERIARVEVVQQPHYLTRHLGALCLLQVEVVDPVPSIGAEPHLQHRVAPIVGHLGVHSPIRLVGPLVHQDVLGLVCPEPVIVELLEPIDVGECLVRGLRVPAIEEPGAVLGPRGSGELDPLEMVGEVFPHRDIAHAELFPVGAARRRAVGEQPPVIGDGEGRQGDRAVVGQEIRIEQRLRLRRERRLLVEDRLILKTVVLEKEVAASLPERRAVLRIVPEFRQSIANGRARRDGGQVGFRQPVLRLDPGATFRRVRILEPAVRIGHSGLVIIVDDVALASGWILERLGTGGRRAREDAGQEEPPREGTQQRSGHLPDKSRGS